MLFRNIGITHNILNISIYCLVFGSIFTACCSPTSIASEKKEVTVMTSLNKKFMLGMGKEVAVQDLDLVIRFISVVKDSRCPKGVKCIWEGDAEILLEVRKGRGEATSVTLHTSQRFNQEGMHGQYKIRIIALMPYPQKDMEIKPESYILTLLAEKD